jgi:hypothetical protein
METRTVVDWRRSCKICKEHQKVPSDTSSTAPTATSLKVLSGYLIDQVQVAINLKGSSTSCGRWKNLRRQFGLQEVRCVWQAVPLEPPGVQVPLEKQGLKNQVLAR